MRVRDYPENAFPFISVTAWYGDMGDGQEFVECDYCDTVWDALGPDVDRLIGLHTDGWITMGKMDFCPDCCGGEVV